MTDENSLLKTLNKIKPDNTPTQLFWQGIIGFVLGMSILSSCIRLTYGKWELVTTGARANGVVMDHSSSKDDVHIRFHTAKGEVVEYIHNGGTTLKAGEKIVVLYREDNPGKKPCADAFGSLWEGSIISFLMGASFLSSSLLQIFWPFRIRVK